MFDKFSELVEKSPEWRRQRLKFVYMVVDHLARDVSRDDWKGWRGLSPRVTVLTSTNAAQQFRKVAVNCQAIFLSHADPQRSGLVESMAAPGGNMTGVSVYMPTVAKTLEVISDLAGESLRLGLVVDSDSNDFFRSEVSELPARTRQAISWVTVDGPQHHSRIRDADRTVQAWIALPTYSMLRNGKDTIRVLLATKKLVAVGTKEDLMLGAHLGVWVETQGLVEKFSETLLRLIHGEPPGTVAVESPVLLRTGLNVKALKDLSTKWAPASIKRFDQYVSSPEP